MARKPVPPSEDRLMRSALSYLDRYGSSEANLRQVLTRKLRRLAMQLGTDPSDYMPLVDPVVARCVRAGLIDDKAYAEARIASERRKGRSARRIGMGLAAKGVDADLIERLMHDARSGDDLSAACIAARKKRIGPWRRSDADFALRQKEIAALCRAGFSVGLSRRVIEAPSIASLMEDVEDASDGGTGFGGWMAAGDDHFGEET